MRSAARVGALALLLAGCGGAPDHPANVAAVPDGFEQVGYASWYGEEVGGRPTASGERSDPDELTAAHRTIPLGSWVAVTALDSGRTVTLRVNDRGPGDHSRIIDLSRGAARALGVDRVPLPAVGLRRVASAAPARRAEPAALAALARRFPPRPAATAAPRLPVGVPLYVQVAAFSDRDRAGSLAERLHGDLIHAGAGLWRVRLGPFADAPSAQHARDAAAARGYGDAQIVSSSVADHQP